MLFINKNVNIPKNKINIRRCEKLAHSKSAKKRIVIAERNRLRNQAVKSFVKTIIKKFETAIEAKDSTAAKETLSLAYKALDKAASKGLFHKNTVARKKSRLTARLNNLINA